MKVIIRDLDIADYDECTKTEQKIDLENAAIRLIMNGSHLLTIRRDDYNENTVIVRLFKKSDKIEVDVIS